MDLNLSVYERVETEFDEMTDFIVINELVQVQFNVDSLNIFGYDDVNTEVDDNEMSDSITVLEFASVQYESGISINVFDSITVTENVTLIRDLRINVVQTIAVAEFVDLTIPLSLSVFQNITLAEFTAETLTFDISVLDSVTTDESVSTYLNVLNFSVLEPFNVLVNEHVDVVDLVVEVGVVMEAITVTDNAEVSLNTLVLSVFDLISITEFASSTGAIDIDVEEDVVIGTPASDLIDYVVLTEFLVSELQIYVSAVDTVAILENVALNVEINVSVFDGIIVSEFTALNVNLELFAYDEATITENTTQYLDALNVSVLEPFNVLITEHVDVVDLVVEVGVLMDAINVLDFASTYLNVLNVSVFDAVAVAENYQSFFDVQNTSVSDDISTTEFVNLIDLVIELGIVFDNVTISENVELVQSIELSAFDAVAVAEFINMVDLVIELGIVSDDIVVTENVSIENPIIYASVFDTVSIAETAQIIDLVIELGPTVEVITVAEVVTVSKDNLSIEANDTVTAIEQFLRDMPINFYVAEQKGISIITVSGF